MTPSESEDVSAGGEAEDELPSLLEGRRTAPLNDREIVAVANTFYGMYRDIEVRYDPVRSTGFRLLVEDGQTVPVITYSADIYPGPNIVNPNSALSMRAAVAHELSHFHRWQDNLELPWNHYRHLDEALTSLYALARYGRDQLSTPEMEQLAADAAHRLQLLRLELPALEPPEPKPGVGDFPDDGPLRS